MKKKNVDPKGRHTGNTPAGKSILRALHDLEDTMAAGIPLAEKYEIHTVNIPDPGEYGAKEVRKLRDRLGVSQAVFAKLIGASTILVSKWEQGTRNPDGMARRLLDDISANPKKWMMSLVEFSNKKAG
jgi:putative transcriptional regulator